MKVFIWLNSILEAFYNRLIENTKIGNLQYFRVLLGFALLFKIKDYSYLAEVSPSLYRPDVLNIANIFNSWLPSFYYQAFYVILIIAGIGIVLGIKARLCFLTVGLISLFQNSFIYSFGKIDHGILFTALAFYFATTNSGTKLAIIKDKKIKYEDLATAIFAILIVFGFFTAGWEKFLVWIDFDLNTSGFLSWFYGGFYSLDRQNLLSPLVLTFPSLLTEIMDYGAVFFEISGIFFLWYNRKSWYLYLLTASLFHLANTLLLNIPFTLHVYVFGLWLCQGRFGIIIYSLLALSILFSHLIIDAIDWFLILLIGLFNYANYLKGKNEITQQEMLKFLGINKYAINKSG